MSARTPEYLPNDETGTRHIVDPDRTHDSMRITFVEPYCGYGSWNRAWVQKTTEGYPVCTKCERAYLRDAHRAVKA